ncbi:rod shape-determining protein MreD [Catenovulum agarivorans DS-2]|uniref:Rod shape-determining protein MreD n=1 Tax=Catenovulum agarivorans DS-2 TaxID=1328313 RepID=W7R1W2_9ALTE|nr:rod shape-determining protein MreD [Catenovulum agarivorans]EWH11605.1 rod shape-determining protein MreD [Catenovulum agarivorans DS-2]
MIGSRSLIALSLLLTLILAMAPLPSYVEAFRPDWVLLVLFYWAIALPHRINVGSAFVVGVLYDILLGNVLGLHALLLSLVVYIAAVNHLTIRNLSIWQQALIVAMVSAFYHLVDYWIQHFLTTVYFLPELLWPAVTNAFIWPWAFLLLRKYRRKLRIR